jgi:hypothetical protein
MMMRWKTGPATGACLLACAICSSRARAEDVIFIVNGTLKFTSDCQARVEDTKETSSKGNRTCGLYWGKSQHSGSRIAFDKSRPDGKFKLIPNGASRTLRDMDLRVVCEVQDDVPCWSHPLGAADYSLPRNNVTIADVELTCTSPVVGASPAKMAEALAAFAETHELLVWAGEEKLEAADAALRDVVARADKALTPDERARYKAGLAAAMAPLRVGSSRGWPLLPSLRRDEFADELIAAAPGWRWLTKPERNDQLPAAYGNRDDRFEGHVVHRVGSTFSDSLVSFSAGPLSVDPETQSSLELTWPASAGARVCLEASPIVPRIGWKMRTAAAASSVSFIWDLSAARSAGVKNNTMGVVARSCIDADRTEATYIPVRATSTQDQETAYRLVFLFPRQLTAISLTVFQGEGASQHTIALPDGAIKFDPNAQAPTVTIDLPAGNLSPGLVHLEMSGRGPGRFGPERLSFVHSQRAGR